jgi:hypothetical protein
MNLARQELPGKGGQRDRVPEGRVNANSLTNQSSLRDSALSNLHPRQFLPG